MAIKHIKRKVASNKDSPTASDIVVVGNYKTRQLDWIKKNGVYNWPVREEDDGHAGRVTLPTDVYHAGPVDDAPGRGTRPACPLDQELANVKELWLYANAKSERHVFTAQFVGKMTNAEFLAAYPSYAKLGPSKQKAYYVFKTTPVDYPPEIGSQIVLARTADFGKRCAKVKKAIEQFKQDGEFAPLAAYLPKELGNVPRQQLRVCEAAVQMDFLSAFDRESLQKKISKSIDIAEHARKDGKLTCVEICAGAGGQAIGLERAGFAHVALVEYEREYCDVLKNNNPEWNVICADVHKFDGKPYAGVDLLAGGVPCPPFSVASKQLGKEDERDLFPEALRLIGEIKPKAVMIENVRGLLDPKFDEYRNSILRRIDELGYNANIKLLHASDFGVPQIRPRVVIVGIRKDLAGRFVYPVPSDRKAPTVGEALRDMMAANGWRGVDAWVKRANAVAPTIVGGSKKHGGPDLGPTRARRAWAELGVDGLGIANTPPQPDFEGNPKLTKEMIAIIQGFPPEWNFGNKKTSACRMIGNAFPPPVAMAVGNQIRKAIES